MGDRTRPRVLFSAPSRKPFENAIKSESNQIVAKTNPAFLSRPLEQFADKLVKKKPLRSPKALR